MEIPEGHNGRVLMTGQEWYDHFERELYAEYPFEGSNQRESQLVGNVIDGAHRAAKKAAGIE